RTRPGSARARPRSAGSRGRRRTRRGWDRGACRAARRAVRRSRAPTPRAGETTRRGRAGAPARARRRAPPPPSGGSGSSPVRGARARRTARAARRRAALPRGPRRGPGAGRTRLARFGERVRLARESFRNLRRAAEAHGVARARALLLDLGVSSHQLEASGRGFSFQRDEPLDMRLDPTRGESAADLVNRLTEAELARILVEYGEERHARRIARAIVRRRPLRTTGDLVAAVRGAVPRAAWPRRLHVATRTFQALRVAVNDEPAALRQALRDAPALLEVGGRLGVIAFHSGEDRIV